MSSVEILRANADRCKQCATLFLRFQEHLPASSEGAVTSVVTDLFTVSRALLELRKSVEDPNNDNYLDTIDKERETVSRSITHTLRDIKNHTNFVEELHERQVSGSSRIREAYEVTWNKIKHHFADEGANITDCNTLTARLETYVYFLKDVKAKLEGDTPSKYFRDMRFRLEKLLQKQEKNFEESMGLGRLSLGPNPPAFKKEKSWERKRPDDKDKRRPRPDALRPDESQRPRRPGRRPDEKPRSHSRTRPGKGKARYDSRDRDDSTDDDSYDHLDSDERNSSELGEPIGYDWDDDEPPSVLSPLAEHYYKFDQQQRPSMFPGRPSFSSPSGGPGYFVPRPPDPPYPAAGAGFKSPVSSAATPTSSTMGSETTGTDSVDSHWLPIAFGLSRPSTPFRASGTESACFGDHDPSALSILHRNGFDRLIKLPFEDSGLVLYIYVRDDDRRAKFLIRQDRSARQSLLACDAVSNLRILRNESCLQLCHSAEDPKGKSKSRRDDGRGGGGASKDRDRPKVYLWTSLRFPSYERMVIFWASFHALKIQDESAALTKLDDPLLDGEKCIFSAVIEDDDYKHALHLLRDRDSRGLRLQASVVRGHMKRCPVWTAFITYQVASREWARRVERRVVGLKELTRFVFMDEDNYTPRLGARGEQELRFVEEGEARKFMEVLRDAAEGKV